MSSGELQLAAALIRSWAADSAPSERFQSRVENMAGGRWTVDDNMLISYPEAVRLATVLTDPSFASYLLNPRFRFVEQVEVLEAAVIAIMEGTTTPALHDLAETIITHGKDAVEFAFAIRRSQSSMKPCRLEKALVVSAQRHRTCLLRHLSTVRVELLRYEPGVASPRNRTVLSRRPMSDELP